MGDNRAVREKEFSQWKDSITSSGEISVAVSFDAANGWRVAIGNLTGKMIMLSHSRAKALAEKALTKIAANDFEENITDVEPLKAHYKDILECANECRMKNRDKVVPQGYAEAMPTAGSA
jgi:hypothetical protein